MGTHKSEFTPIHKLQKYLRRMRGKSEFMAADEAERYRRELAEICRSKFGLSLHPLQTSLSMVPPASVVNAVQGRNKADASTFLGSGYRDMARYIEELAANGHDIARMERMLDFGFGTGRMLLHFLPFSLERYGCDVNPAAVEWASKTLGNFAKLQLSAPVPPLPYEDGFFDLVIASAVFTHIPVSEQPSWVAELSRVLKPGGCVLATVHDFSKITGRHKKLGWQEKGIDRGLHMNSYVSPEMLQQIWGGPFEILEVRRFPPRQAHVIARASSRLATRREEIHATHATF